MGFFSYIEILSHKFHTLSWEMMIWDIALLCSLAWLIYRFWDFWAIPLDVLVEKLGCDIPPEPEVSLGIITSDSVLLYWKPPDIQTGPLELSIQVNGIKVGEFSKTDNSIQITGLKPGDYYNIRVLATNSSNFTTLGSVIRLRTKPLPTVDHDGDSSLGDNSHENEPAAVHATPTPFETNISSPPSREVTSNQQQTRRIVSGRHNSPIISGGEHSATQGAQIAGNDDDDESPEALERLTQRLNFLRAEKERVDKETAEEEEESRRNIAELTKQRDQLKQEYKEKEDASSEMRKQSSQLEKLNRAAQNRKAAKEKQLQQRKAERQRFKDDAARLEREVIEMKQDVERMKKEKAEILAANDRDIAKIRKGTAEDLEAIKQLEEEIRLKGADIKTLEKQQEKLEAEATEGEQTSLERESDHAWEDRMQVLRVRLGSVWQTFQQAQLEQQQAEEHLTWWMEKRARNPEEFAPIPSLDSTAPMKRNRSRRSRQPSSRASTISSPSVGYQNGLAAVGNSSPNVPQPFSGPSPFFNMGNGTAVPPLPERLGLAQVDAETLSGGGPVSPAASNLLPSNLFREEEMTNHHSSEGTSQDPPAMRSTLEAPLGHAITNSDASTHGLHAPASTGSRPVSMLSGILDNAPNLHGDQSRQDSMNGRDQLSSNSTIAAFDHTVAAEVNPMATSRLSNLFSSTFNRQRGKPGNQEPPVLGTLKQGQSQSFPSDLEEGALHSDGGQTRGGSRSNWANPMSGLLNRNAGRSEGSELLTARTGSGRRSMLNMFAPRAEGFNITGLADHHSSSRPSSTYSFDQILARPSSDSQRFGWNTPETVPNRGSPLGTRWHWASGPWSNAPSRRPSVQHGSTSNLSIGSTPLDAEGLSSSFSKQSSEQAPIGTRPQSSQRPATPRLNPAAPTFKTLFTRDTRKAAKTEKSGNKTAEKPKEKENEKGEMEDKESLHDSSPQASRRSRDAQSIITAASAADSYESLDRSTSGTPSEAVTPSGPKETLMQKITRKSSSSKFNVPWGKERSLFSKRAGEPSTPGEIDADIVGETTSGKSIENSNSTTQQEKVGRSSISWPNMRRKSRKGDQALTEPAERGSEASDDDDKTTS